MTDRKEKQREAMRLLREQRRKEGYRVLQLWLKPNDAERVKSFAAMFEQPGEGLGE